MPQTRDRDPYPFIMTPDQHRRQAAKLRALKDPKLLPLANELDQLARVIEQRLNMSTPSPSMT